MPSGLHLVSARFLLHSPLLDLDRIYVDPPESDLGVGEEESYVMMMKEERESDVVNRRG